MGLQAIPDKVKLLRSRIRLRERLPIWGIRLVFGMTLLTLSELVMWQNPLRRDWFEWPVLLLLYTCLGAFMLDLTARFQAYTPAALGLVSGVYGLVSSTVINHTALESFPVGLLSRGLGLQVGAGFLALMLFVTIMRGKAPNLIALGAAALTGIAWAIWLHWYPIQPAVNWGQVDLAQAQTAILPAMLITGVLYWLLVPRFGTLRETQLGMYWWEMLIAGLPLFVTLLIGMLQEVIPFLPLLLPMLLGAFCVWALRFQKPETDPSILGQITFASPNLITFLAICVAFLAAGSLAYGLVVDKDSPVGAALYVIVLGFGSAWLPFACFLIFWELLRTRYAPENQIDDDTP